MLVFFACCGCRGCLHKHSGIAWRWDKLIVGLPVRLCLGLLDGVCAHDGGLCLARRLLMLHQTTVLGARNYCVHEGRSFAITVTGLQSLLCFYTEATMWRVELFRTICSCTVTGRQPRLHSISYCHLVHGCLRGKESLLCCRQWSNAWYVGTFGLRSMHRSTGALRD